tara:strand:- start:1232 stop:1441 length:210 start_codon:yes stop_codon:yes gene_type:complete
MSLRFAENVNKSKRFNISLCFLQQGEVERILVNNVVMNYLSSETSCDKFTHPHHRVNVQLVIEIQSTGF